MNKEQIFQLKLAATDLAIKAGATDTGLVPKAQEIYDFLTVEALEPKEDRVIPMMVRKPTVSEIQSNLD